MIRGFTILLLFQLLGEALVRLLRLPIPGPVMGMLALFGALLLRRTTPPDVDAAAQQILGHLSLLFIPAGVGIMTYAALLREEWLPIGAALLLSTPLTLMVTAWTLRLLMRLGNRPPEEAGRSA